MSYLISVGQIKSFYQIGLMAPDGNVGAIRFPDRLTGRVSKIAGLHDDAA